jgi:hypothetical protein
MDNDSYFNSNKNEEKKKKTSFLNQAQLENQNKSPFNSYNNNNNINKINQNFNKNLNDSSKEKIIIEENYDNQINTSQLNSPTIKTENAINENSQLKTQNENQNQKQLKENKKTENDKDKDYENNNTNKNKDVNDKDKDNNKDNNKYHDIEILLSNKPELNEVPKEFKIKVLKKIIPFIERSSKNLKPGVHNYTQKLLGLSMKPAIKQKFYEILKDEILDLSFFDTNLILLMGGELLNSNREYNINPSLLQMKEFNENYLENQMNPDAIEIFVKFIY